MVLMTQFEKTFNFMTKIWVIITYITLVILSYYFVDRALAIYFHKLDLRVNFHALTYLTALGKWKIYVVLFLITALYFRYIQQNKKYEIRSWYLLGCVLLPNLLTFVLKISLSRARPDLLFDNSLYGFYWFQLNDNYWSFPSGHSITITALAAGLGFLFPRYFFLLIGVALLVAATRVILYHHYLSDVMAGFYISMLVVGLFTRYLQRNHYLNKVN
ncbi:TPA: phosphatase PAP2 family protein [Legionella pneumophila]|uniref:undecaprenyl-diphosphate phosphatase n=2 Tax=Legionella pneumophila TaxID=446 RepID=A0A2S6F1Y5_LEGPN|nr:phosphatase PAP2 family protein [Legionella pneumophila]RYB37377.1 phosphatase PAP2 family protein [Legionella pneumophila]RYW30100.1 phosphatase PAP2 family protein [Legionella pneumophila]TIH04066.1 phosphatase PAP2 family protein [Legionella pneumophila]HAT6361286.1 phosphatase PAP2 family protein [Legionella pneumophila]